MKNNKEEIINKIARQTKELADLSEDTLINFDKTTRRRQRKADIEEVEKIIDELASLRLYRSKSCQLMMRRLKQKLLGGEDETNL